MVSQFDMNQPPRVCNICIEVHPISTTCKYDRLVKLIHTLKHQVVSLLKGNKEIVETAKAFQNIIVTMEKELIRLYEVEKLYGPKNIQAIPPTEQPKEVQPTTENIEHVRPKVGIVPPEISSSQP